MKGNKRLLVVLAIAVALLTALVPVAGHAEAYQTYVSGLECAYVVTPGQVEYHGNTMQIIDQVDQDLFISDDSAVFPDAVAVVHVDIAINMVTGKATAHSTAVLQPDGMARTWEGHADFHLSSIEGARQATRYSTAQAI
jgi:hypothetical protein